MTRQPDVPNQFVEYCGGIGFDGRLIDAVVVEASIHAPTGIIHINRFLATRTLYEVAIGDSQEGIPDWVRDAAHVIWMNRNEILNADVSRPRPTDPDQ